MSDPATVSQYRVLVVEDTPDLRQIVKISLRPMEVVTAEHGLDGLMKLDRVEPDFIISDVMMPEMDGWEFIRRVRQRPAYQRTPVIYLTALSSRDDMKRGYETGADVYLTKPYDPERLKRNLDIFIDRFKMQPRAKRLSLAEIEAEDERRAQAPLVPKRETIRPSLAEAEEAPADPFRASPPIPKPSELPRHAPPSPRAPAPPKGTLPPRLLLITVDSSLAAEIRSLASADTFELVLAQDSPTAMDMTSLFDPDALLLHWQLPKGHAPALAELFGQSPECRGKPVIVISDKRLGGGERRSLDRMGVFDTVRRPLKGHALSDLLEDVNQVTHPKSRENRMPWAEVLKALEGMAKRAQGDDVVWEG